MKKQDDKPFFIGYLDMPAPLKRFYKPLVMLMLIVSALVGYSIASMQSGVSHAHWSTEAPETITGLLTLDPYPVVHRIDPADPQKIESILLVRQGKHSAEEYSKPFENQMVTLTGFPIRRGGWTMIEIAAAHDIKADTSIEANVTQEIKTRVAPISLGGANLQGEVADSKCFLGVMKPGAGKVHRACAEVCILGGIPPMLLVRGTDDLKYGYLLTEPDGSSAAKNLYQRSADRIALSGELLQRGDLLYLKMSAENSI